MGKLTAAVLVLCLPLASAGQEAKTTPAAVTPAVSIRLTDRHAQVAPERTGCTYTGGGNIDVQQPAPDTVVITVTGAVVATDHPCGSAARMAFDLEQGLEIVFERPDVAAAKLTVEAQVAGLLRGGRRGAASVSDACATVAGGGVELVTVCVPGHGVAGCEGLAVKDRAGPVSAPVGPGCHTLHAHWLIEAVHPKALLGKSASAEFAPEPALEPLWVGGPRDSFRGAAKKDFGFRLTLRVVGETPNRQP